jgi:hypothetical protein
LLIFADAGSEQGSHLFLDARFLGYCHFPLVFVGFYLEV